MWKIESKTYKLLEDREIFRNNKFCLKVKQGAKVLKVFYREKHVGYAFKGLVKYAVDTVIETPQGAIGKPVKRMREDLAIVFANPIPVLKLSGVEADIEFIEEVLDVCEDLVEENKISPKTLRSKSEYFISVFPRENYYEIIVAKGDKLVYVARNTVYITASPSENILVSDNKIIISSKNKLLYVPKIFGQLNIMISSLTKILNN